MKMNFAQRIQNAITQAVASIIPQVFAGAAAADTANMFALTSAKTRAIATSALLEQIYSILRERNDSARHIDEYGNVYIDWNEYLIYFDTFYDDGALFVICTRAGKVYRIPVTVAADVPTLGEPQEVPMTRTKSRVWITRDANGKRRWAAIAGSAVLNRSQELDSTRLFDSFIKRAMDTGVYPVLSFYHMPETMRFGVADHLFRDEYLYLQTGTFFEDETSQAIADGLERAAADPNAPAWGVSIGFNSFGDPELLDIGDGVQIPMYVDGENVELSIVLEQDAAALFTRMSAVQEVNTRMHKDIKTKLAQLAGPAIADDLENATDGANRTIAETGMVARAQTDAVPAPVAETPPAVAPAATIETPVAVAPVTPPAVPATTPTTETRETPQELELDDALFDGLVAAIQASPAQVALTQSLTQISTQLQELGTRLGTVEAAQTENRARVAALEVDEDTRTAAVIADMPRRHTVITYRARDQRPVETEEETAPTSEDIANATLAKIPTALRGHQPAQA